MINPQDARSGECQRATMQRKQRLFMMRFIDLTEPTLTERLFGFKLPRFL